MIVNALILFGSCARGDQTKDSDVDMLAIHDEGIYRVKEYEKLYFSFYPEQTLRRMMLNGELFALHLATESKIIFENAEKASDLFKLFQFKSSYAPVIDEAKILAWAIIKFYSKINEPLLCNKRLVWCVRTICAANAASERRNCFAASEIIKSVPIDDMDWVLAQKNNVEHSPRLIAKMVEFLHYYALEQPESVRQSEFVDGCLPLFDVGSMGYRFFQSLKKPRNLGYP